MTKELIVNSSDEGVEIALLEDKRLVELHYEAGKGNFTVGDLYLGKVKKLMPGLNAAFVDVGYEKDAFLHYTDLSPYFKSLQKFSKDTIQGEPSWGTDFSKFSTEKDIQKSGKIIDVVTSKTELLVQILKEPISNKGPRLSCEISLPGRFLVMTPFNDIIAVSRKIQSSDERKRLQRIVESIKPKNFGIIVRTAAEGKSTSELHSDILQLNEKWDAIRQNMKGAKAPSIILNEQNKTTSIIRDLLSPSFEKIVVNDKQLLQETKTYIQGIAPEKENIVCYHNGGVSLFDTYGITKQVKASFGKTVNISSGAYLIIEHTEALHVIDVNSGTRSGEGGQEQNALTTNLEAAKEVARQMRLRDLGGIIIIDFIDMRLPENKRKLGDAMTAAMEGDRARHTILPISKFGLMQITRQRLRPEVTISTAEACPSCKGTGKIGPSILLADDIERDLNYLKKQGHHDLLLHVHPIVEAYLLRGSIFKPSIAKRWQKSLQLRLQVKADSHLPITNFKFFDVRTNEHINL